MVARSASHIEPEPSPPGNGGAGEIVVEDHFLDDPGAAGIRAAMNQIRQRRRQAVDVPVIASRTNVTPTSVAGGYTILESVKPFRTALEGHDSNVCLQDLRDLAVEFRRQLHAQLQQSGSNQLWPSFDATKRDMFGGNGAAIPTSVRRYVDRLFDGEALLAITNEAIAEGAYAADYFKIFIEAASRMRVNISGGLQTARGDGPFATSRFALETFAPTEDKRFANAIFLLRNRALNWLRLPGVINPIEYDRLHKRGMYVFTNATDPNHFASFATGYMSDGGTPNPLIRDQRILTIGPGNGEDEIHFLNHGAASVDMIEGSTFMLNRLRDRKGELGDMASRFHVPEDPRDMIQELQRMNEAGDPKHDFVYGHSVTHYFDDPTLTALLSLIRMRITDDGYFAFAVKAPEAHLDSDDAGILLIDDAGPVFGIVEADDNGPQSARRRAMQEVGTSVRSRMRLNLDGQTRAFRDRDAWVKLLEPWFIVESDTKMNVEDYETLGQPAQEFYYFICRPKPDVTL